MSPVRSVVPRQNADNGGGAHRRTKAITMHDTTPEHGFRRGCLRHRPGAALAFLAAALIAVTGGLPSAERLYAHLTAWSAGLGTCGTPVMRLVLLGIGAAAAVLAHRRLTGTSRAGHPRS
jgi:hypothetical protein